MKPLCVLLVGVAVGWAASGVDWSHEAVGQSNVEGVLFEEHGSTGEDRHGESSAEAGKDYREHIANQELVALCDSRDRTFEKLITVVKRDSGFSDDDQRTAIFVLGIFREGRAAPILVERMKDFPPASVSLEMNPLDDPVPQALIRMGQDAVGPLMRLLKSTDEVHSRESAISVLYNIVGGKDNLVRMLTKMQEKESVAEVRGRIDRSIDLVSAKYRDAEDPSY